jgi:Holliday junction resolvase RusA-like endonuclease
MKRQTAPSELKEFSFTIPMTPPGVNNYVKHTRSGRHYKTPQAVAWENTFATHAPNFAVRGKTFYLRMAIVLGKKERLDVDNGCKCALDSIANAGMLLSYKQKRLSDAWIEQLDVSLDRTTRPEIGWTLFTLGVLT